MTGAQHERTGQAPLLTDRRPIPRISGEQLSKFTPEALRTKLVGPFDPLAARDVLRKNEGRKVIGVDLGGDKVIAIPFTIRGGLLVPDDQNSGRVASRGTGSEYVPFLQSVSEKAEQQNIPIGISCAGLIDGTRLIQSPNLPGFQEDFERHGLDFTQLMPTVKAVDNDAVATVKAAVLEAVNTNLFTTNGEDTIEGVLLPIIGGGLGGSGFKRSQTEPSSSGYIYAMEPGHVELVPLVQAPGQRIPDEPCGMGGAEFVCVERAIAGVAGIESRWKKTTGQRLSGKEIGDLYRQGNILATSLYDTSATLLTTAIVGMGNALGLLQEPKDTLVAFHGSINKEPGYKERVAQILAQEDVLPHFAFTGDFSVNAGAEGAAIAALMGQR